MYTSADIAAALLRSGMQPIGQKRAEQSWLDEMVTGVGRQSLESVARGYCRQTRCKPACRKSLPEKHCNDCIEQVCMAPLRNAQIDDRGLLNSRYLLSNLL